MEQPSARFENVCPYTYANLLTLYRKGRPWWVNVLLGVMTVLGLVLVAFTASEGQWASCALMALFAVVYGYYWLAAPIRQAKRRAAQYGPDQPHRETSRFYEDTYVSGEDGAYLKYNKIYRIIETKELFILVVKPQLYCLADKAGFTQGSAESFRQFLTERAPQAKYRRPR